MRSIRILVLFAATVAAACSRSVTIRPTPAAEVVSSGVAWPLDRIDQRDLPLDGVFRRQGTGQGVSVYVFGEGISFVYPALTGRVRPGFAAFPGDRSICTGHSTAVAGAIAATDFGVAPGATIVDVKVIECGMARLTAGSITRAAQWVANDVATRGGPAVVTWPFVADTTGEAAAVRDAAATLRAAGIAVITIANPGRRAACALPPSDDDDGMIAVGAMDSTVVEASGSSECVELFAPALYPDPVWRTGRSGSAPQVWSTGAVAAGYAAGAAALYLELHPSASPAELTAALIDAATTEATTASSRRVLYVGSTVGR
jgi:hypothetical protein